VPPPMATTRKPRTDWFLFLDCFFTSGSAVEQFRFDAEFHLSHAIHCGRVANEGSGNRHIPRTCLCLQDVPGDQDYPA